MKFIILPVHLHRIRCHAWRVAPCLLLTLVVGQYLFVCVPPSTWPKQTAPELIYRIGLYHKEPWQMLELLN